MGVMGVGYVCVHRCIQLSSRKKVVVIGVEVVLPFLMVLHIMCLLITCARIF